MDLITGQPIYQLVNNNYNKFYILGYDNFNIYVESNPKSKKRCNNYIKIFNIEDINKTLFLKKK